MPSKTYRFTLTSKVAFILSYDDVCMLGDLGITEEAGKYRAPAYSTDYEGMVTVLSDLESRAEWSLSGWDQPRDWRYAARTVAPRVARQVLAQNPTGRLKDLAESILRKAEAK